MRSHRTNRVGQRGVSFVGILVVLFLLISALVFLAPRFIRTHTGHDVGCRNNLAVIGTALEMYAADDRGRYPPRLDSLTVDGRYLSSIPAGRPTYSITVRQPVAHKGSPSPGTYTIVCSGDNHAGEGLAPNYPQFVPRHGLLLQSR